jgi:hypothetical protein
VAAAAATAPPLHPLGSDGTNFTGTIFALARSYVARTTLVGSYVPSHRPAHMESHLPVPALTFAYDLYTWLHGLRTTTTVHVKLTGAFPRDRQESSGREGTSDHL